MSWLRTMLLASVVALLVGKFAVVPPVTPTRLLVVAAVFAGWLAILAVGWRRTAAMTQPVPPSLRWAAPLVTFIALGYAAIGVVFVAVR